MSPGRGFVAYLDAFYAGEVDVDVVTLRPFGHISIPSPALADKS